jgi:hypothetical protein
MIDNSLVVYFLGGTSSGICPSRSDVDMSVITTRKCDLRVVPEILKGGINVIFVCF